ncbi:hypothetical protein PBI_SEANDERSON_63 [Mycobacterium phage Seanderson]|nr:HNH endonuclease [Mycobacterium phage Carlyle]URQ04589.1 hypothetical protein PBI_SEANDERSON_63 [Mycobacterium phage Seanderson]
MTNELRDVLTEALKAHQVYQCSRSGWDEESIQWWQCHGCDFKSNTFPIKGINRVVLGEEIAADHLAEIIASLPGVAVIQLPDEMTDRTNVAEKIRRQPMWEHQGSWATVEGDEVEFEADNQMVCGVIPVNSVPGLVSVLAAAAAVVAEGEA